MAKRRTDGGTTAEPPFSGAYGVSCRARAKRAALHRAKTAIRPWPPWWPLGPPPPSGGAGRSSAGHNDRGKIPKLSAVMCSGLTDRSSMPGSSPRAGACLRLHEAVRAPLAGGLGLAREHRVDERERHLGARPQAGREHELVRRVGAPAERPEAVDGERDLRGEVACVARAAAARADD